MLSVSSVGSPDDGKGPRDDFHASTCSPPGSGTGTGTVGATRRVRGSASSGGECEDCRAKRLRRSASGAGPQTAPAIVLDVMRAPGAPLDGATRLAMEPRFGHSFADVRVPWTGGRLSQPPTWGARLYPGEPRGVRRERYAPDSRDGRAAARAPSWRMWSSSRARTPPPCMPASQSAP